MIKLSSNSICVCLDSSKQAFICYYSFTVPGSVQSLGEAVTFPRQTGTLIHQESDCEDLMGYLWEVLLH